MRRKGQAILDSIDLLQHRAGRVSRRIFRAQVLVVRLRHKPRPRRAPAYYAKVREGVIGLKRDPGTRRAMREIGEALDA